MINVDTDMIIPKVYLKTIKRTGLGKALFAEMRFDEHGDEIADFVLNKEPFPQGQDHGFGDQLRVRLEP